MTRNARFLMFLFTLALLASGLAVAAEPAEPTILGQSWQLDPEATERVGPREFVEAGVFRTISDPALVVLDNGRALKLQANSSIVLRETGDRVEVTVLSGKVTLVDDQGETLRAGSGSMFKLDPGREDAETAADRVLRRGVSEREERERRPAKR